MSNFVPEGWEYKPLSSLADIDKGSLKASTDSDYKFRYIDIASVSTGRIDLPSERISFAEAPSRARKKVQSGDVLMSTVRPNLKSFAYFEAKGNDYIASTGFSVIRAVNGNDGRFLFNSILADDITRQIEAKIVGSNYPAINSSDVKNLEVLTPTKPEQKKIAKILTSVDDVIEKTQAQIDKLKDLKTGMMQELLTRGVGVDGKPHTKFKDSPVGRIPKAWDVVKLSSVLSKIDSGWSPACIEVPPATGEWGVVKVSAVTRGRFLEKESKTLPEELKPKLHIQIKRDDILLTRANGVADLVGKCVMVSKEPKAKLMMSDKILRLNVNNKVYSKFLLHYFNSRQIRKQIELSWGGSSGQKNISKADIKGYFIALPSLNEQIVIGDSISQIDTLLSVREAKLRKLEDSKKALMQDLLTGKVRVTPDEEDCEC